MELPVQRRLSRSNSRNIGEMLDVLVIGAGLSGLSSALHLLDRVPESKLLVLEANDRVGGRTLSIEIDGPDGETDSLDMGAHWVASSQPDILELMKRYDIGYYPQNIKGTKVLQVGDNKVRTYASEIPNLTSWHALIQLQRMIDKLEDLAKKVDIRDPYASPLAHELDGMTAETYFRKTVSHDSVIQIMNAAVQASLGCDSSQLSMLFLAAYANSGGGFMKLLLVENGAAQEYRVKGGSQNISVKMAKEIGEHRIMLNKAVVKMVQDELGHVKVYCKNGEMFEAKRVICSAPANQVFQMELDPPMSNARTTLYKNFNMGNLMKVYVLYEEAFWLKDGYSGEVVSTGGPTDVSGCESGPLTIVYDATTHKGTPALIGFMSGRNGDQWFSKTLEERKEAIFKQLADFFGPHALDPIDYYEKDWTRERYAGGGPVSLLPPGFMHNFHLLRQPHGHIYFAGTEMALEWCGYMSGAVQAGYKAAADVIKELDETKLTWEDERLLENAKVGVDTEYREVERKSRDSQVGREILIIVAMLLCLVAIAVKYF